MNHLHNSKGKHIANFVNGQLYSPNGRNVAHYLDNEGIFIDMRGRYMGEIVHGNRLMYSRNSPYRSVNFGVYGNCGNVGNYGNPGHAGSIGIVAGYEDIPEEKLR